MVLGVIALLQPEGTATETVASCRAPSGENIFASPGLKVRVPSGSQQPHVRRSFHTDPPDISMYGYPPIDCRMGLRSYWANPASENCHSITTCIDVLGTSSGPRPWAR